MAFKRRSRRFRRRSMKRKTSPKKYYSKRYPVRKALVSIAKNVKTLKKDIELKVNSSRFDSYNGTTATTTLAINNPHVSLVNGLTKGTGFNVRTGDTVKATSIRIKGTIYVTSVANRAGIDSKVRIMLVDYKKPRGATMSLILNNTLSPGVSPLFTGTGTSPQIWQAPDWGLYSHAWENFKILYDRVFNLRTHTTWYDGTNPQSLNPEITFNIVRKLGTVVDYTRGNAGTVADIESHAYYIIVFCDTTTTLTLAYDSRFYFKDA